jgi:glycosyltransferase involved in cell wall biosynthesis
MARHTAESNRVTSAAIEPGQAHSDRVIHVPRRFTEREWGGTETVIYEVCKAQQNGAWAPEIATSKALDSRAQDTIESVPIHRFEYCYPFFGLSKEEIELMDKKGGNLFSFPLLKYLYQTKGVRIFHAHALKRVGGIVRTAARRRRLPYVVSLHGGVFDVPQSELEGMMKPIENKFEWGRVLGALLGSRRVLEDADHVICVGKTESEKARNELSHDRVSYLPNGVDTEKFNGGNGTSFREKHGIANDTHITLCLSRIDPQKNQICLVHAFAKVHHTDGKTALVIIGPPTHPGYAKQIDEAIKAHGLDHAVHVIPGLSNTDPELIDAFHAADVFVLPSLHEPFGIVILEAWSCQKPVIASRVGGLKTVVKDQSTGLFFDPNSEGATTELATLIQRLKNNPHEAQALAEAGNQVAKSQYGWKALASQLEGIYDSAEDQARFRWGKP